MSRTLADALLQKWQLPLPATRVVDAIVARSVERKQPSHEPGSSTSRMTTAGSMIGDKPGKHWWRPTFLLSLLSNAGAPSSPLCCSNRVSLHAPNFSTRQRCPFATPQASTHLQFAEQGIHPASLQRASLAEMNSHQCASCSLASHAHAHARALGPFSPALILAQSMGKSEAPLVPPSTPFLKFTDPPLKGASSSLLLSSFLSDTSTSLQPFDAAMSAYGHRLACRCKPTCSSRASSCSLSRLLGL